MSDTTTRLWGVVEPYVAAEGIELDDLEVVGEGTGTIVRVTVDGPSPIGVDRMAQLSRGLSRLLDEADPFPGSYTLEVGSPGLERKLRRTRHYEKAVGREVKVKTTAEIAGSRNHRGVVREAGEVTFTLEVDGEPHSIPYADVSSARTVFTWEAAPKPGRAH